MNPARVRNKLLTWFAAHARDLPWRRTKDPYAVWVSEVMLQQTRVETVIPYFERFMRRFPTATGLARAPEDQVLALWSGLGYYRRARLLHRGAKEVAARHGGAVPRDPEARRALPGIGRYTAGAIGSIAFGLEEPLVDGNVARVIARLENLGTPLGERRTEAALWAHAEALVRGTNPGDLNQALMELGATVCTPKRPSCGACPVRGDCAAFTAGTAERLPVPRAKRPPKRQIWHVVVVRDAKGRALLVRGEKDLFGGLWSPPHAPEAPDAHGQDAPKSALRGAGLTPALKLASAGTFRHVLTHRDLTVVVWRARARTLPRGQGARWVSDAQLSALGISALTKKALSLAAETSRQSAKAAPPKRRRTRAG